MQTNNLSGSNQSRFTKVVVVLFLIFSWLLFINLLINKTPVHAFQNNDKFPISKQQNRTKLYALIACLDGHQDFDNENQLRDTVTAKELNNRDIYGEKREKDSGDQVAVGHELQNNDGRVLCENIDHEGALGFANLTYELYIDKIYRKTGNVDGDGVPLWILQAGVTGDSVAQRLINRVVDKRQSGSSILGRQEALRRVSVALGHCVERDTASISEFDEDATETFSINGKKYQYIDGRSGDDNISVGWDLEENNGTYTCNNLRTLGDDALKQYPLGGPEGSVPGGTTKPEDIQLADCDTKLLNPLSWVICPLIDLGSGGTDFVFQEVVEPLLSDIPLSTNPRDPFFEAWQGFRVLANIMIIGGMLAIVYAQSKGEK